MKLSNLQINSSSGQMYFKEKIEQNHKGYKKVCKLTLYFVKPFCLKPLWPFHSHKMQNVQEQGCKKGQECT